MNHSGGCLCGNVRFNAEGDPLRVGLCHCRYCQLRTGSAFGISVYFPEDAVTSPSGELETYALETENGNTLRIERCENCGTSVFWRIDSEAYAGMTGIAGGCFDPPTFWYDITREVFTRSKAKFCTIDAQATHETHPVYAPKSKDDPRLSGGS